VEIGAVCNGSCKPQSCQKQKDNVSTEQIKTENVENKLKTCKLNTYKLKTDNLKTRNLKTGIQVENIGYISLNINLEAGLGQGRNDQGNFLPIGIILL